MKKLLLILLLCSVAQATTYTIGPGQTYETFAALEAGVVLAGDDIVDGGANTFTEIWTPATGGTSGHPITLRNATINAAGARAQCVNVGTRDYISISNMTLSNATSGNVEINGADGVSVTGCTISGGATGVYQYGASDNLTVTNTTIADCTSRGLWSASTGSNVTLTTVTVTGTTTNHGVQISTAGTVNVTDLQVTGCLGAANGNGLYVVNIATGTITLDTLYLGVTRLGVASGNAKRGLFFQNIDAALNLDTVIASNNGNVGIEFQDTDCLVTATDLTCNGNAGHGIYFNGSAMTAGSTLTTFTSNDSTAVGGCGIYLISSSTITISNGTANGNSSGVYTDASSAITISGVSAAENLIDGFDSKNGSANVTWQYCRAIHNGTVGQGIIDGSGDGYSWHDTCATHNMLYCLALRNLNTAVAHVDTSSGLIYGCTFANNGSDDDVTMVRGGVYLTTTHATGFTVRDCISSGNYPCELYEGATSNNDLNYNCWNPLDADQFWTDDGAAYKSWNTYHLTDANENNSFRLDPLLTDVDTNDVTLKQGSPCVNTGVNLGASYDDALDPSSVWPSAVVTVDQDSYEQWDIGAFAWATLPVQDFHPRYQRASYRGLNFYRARYRFNQ